MATTPVSQSLNRGGAFLISSSAPGDVFTPADLTDDQRLVGQTAEEFVANEVVPQIPELEQHKEGLMPLLLKKAGELGLLGGGIAEEYGGSGLDKISATVLAEKLAGYASFAVSHGAHSGIGTVPIVYFGTEEQKKKYLPKIAGLAHPRGFVSRRQELAAYRPEDVDHQRRIRGRVRGVRQGGRRKVLVLHRRARHAGLFGGRGRKENGHPRQFDGAAVF
jgi:hypothetical protein